MRTRKLTVEVPEALYERLQQRIPWGSRNHLFAPVLDVIVTAVEKDGPIVMGAIMAGTFSLQWSGKDGKRD